MANEYTEVTVDVLTTGAFYTIYSDTIEWCILQGERYFHMVPVCKRWNSGAMEYLPPMEPINFTITYGDQTCNVLSRISSDRAGGPWLYLPCPVMHVPVHHQPQQAHMR